MNGARTRLFHGLGFALFGVAAAGQTPGASAPAAPARSESVRDLVQRARAEAGRKETPAALQTLKRALALAPNSEDVLAAYAQVSLAARAPVPAILALEPLTRMCPTVAQYHYLLGVALMQAGDMEAAELSLREAEKIEPDRALTLVALGLALNSRKRYQEARPFLERGVEREPDNVEAMAALAESEEGLGDPASAEAHARRALERAPANGTANLVIGLLRMKQERYTEARDALERAVAADPAAAKTHYQLSLAFARLGDETSSRQHLEIYRQRLREIEERLKEIRGATGLSGGAIQP
jgi:tetratricopeptide (TPR) repeat protein